MQLIMDAENTSIDIREKMSTLDQESLSDKPVLNGVQDPESDVPNGNKENIETKNNIIDNVSLDNEIKLMDEAVISSSVTEDSGDEDKTENKGSDEQVPHKGDANIEEKSIEDIVAEMDSFDDIENTSGETAKETEKEEKSVNDICSALEDVTDQTICIDDPRETDCNKADEKKELNKKKAKVPDNEEQIEDKFTLTEETGIDKNEKIFVTEDQENDANLVVENAEIDNVDIDKSVDNVIEDKVENVIADETEDNTATDQHLEKDEEEETENVLLQDINLTVNTSVNNSEKESDKSVQQILEKKDSKTEEISLENGNSKIDEVEKIEPMETSQLSETSSNEVNSSEIVSTVVSKNEAQNTMDCDEKPTDKTEEVAQTADSSDKTSEIVTNGAETSINESKNDEEPMECEQISEVSTSANFDASINANDGDVVDTCKIGNVSEKQTDSVKLENEVETKTTGDCEITDLIEPICDKKDEESISMKCNDIIGVPEPEKNNDIFTTSSESKAEILDVDEIKETTEDKKEEPVKPDSVVKNQEAVQKEPETKPAPSTPTIKLSNTLDILSDDEDEPPKASETPKALETPKPDDDKCINIEDDDDIMLIDDIDDTNSKDDKEITDVVPEVTEEIELKTEQNTININDLKENKSIEESVTIPKTGKLKF